MIEKFNFYDVYGYFVPGAAFIAILWLPFGLAGCPWPESTWAGATIAVVTAYIAGYLIQNVAANALVPRNHDGRLPSEVYLDNDKVLPHELRKRIQESIGKQFGLELKVEEKGNEAIDKARNNAFLLARQVLIQGKAASYAEQSQGMYAFTLGLVSALSLASAYWTGFAATAFLRQCVPAIVIVLGLTLSFLVLGNLSLLPIDPDLSPLQKRRREREYFAVVLIAFLLIGYACGLQYQLSHRYGVLLLSLSAGAFIAALRAYGACKHFAGLFAATVWRDYLAYNVAAALRPKSE